MALSTGANVAVIGAGPMGLACAHALAQAGCRVTLFEADDRIGGMSAFFDFDGLAIERYYHFICKPDAPLFAVLDEFGLTDRLRVIAAVNSLGNMGTHEAAVRLTQYLVLLNSYTERLREYDNSIVLAVIENLGKLRDKIAFDDLMYAQYLDYSNEIKSATRKALEKLQW